MQTPYWAGCTNPLHVTPKSRSKGGMNHVPGEQAKQPQLKASWEKRHKQTLSWLTPQCRPYLRKPVINSDYVPLSSPKEESMQRSLSRLPYTDAHLPRRRGHGQGEGRWWQKTKTKKKSADSSPTFPHVPLLTSCCRGCLIRNWRLVTPIGESPPGRTTATGKPFSNAAVTKAKTIVTRRLWVPYGHLNLLFKSENNIAVDEPFIMNCYVSNKSNYKFDFYLRRN